MAKTISIKMNNVLWEQFSQVFRLARQRPRIGPPLSRHGFLLHLIRLGLEAFGAGGGR